MKHYESDALGLASFHEGAGQAESSNTTRKVFSISLESISGTGLDAMGSSSRQQIPRRETGSVKSVLLPSREEATPLGETVGCGDVLRASSTTSFGKPCEGLRLIAGQRNKLEDWTIRSVSPKGVIEKPMVPVQRLQSCRSQMRDYSSRCGLRYSPAAHESAWVN